MYLVNMGVSYGDEHYRPGEIVSLDGWPAGALEQLAKDHIITFVGATTNVPDTDKPGAEENEPGAEENEPGAEEIK